MKTVQKVLMVLRPNYFHLFSLCTVFKCLFYKSITLVVLDYSDIFLNFMIYSQNPII